MSDAIGAVIDPAKVDASHEHNSRFGLKQSKLDPLKESIRTQGGVLQPVGLVKLTPPSNGHTHRLVFGFYRHEAVKQLKAEGVDVELPYVELDEQSEAELLRTQIEENARREDQSPMDKAVSIQKLLEAGVEKAEIRRIFSVVGGKKGDQVRPLSNAMLNIYLRFLELPKAIQEKIHNGSVSVSAAYQLGRVSPEKRAAVLEDAEKERARAEEQEAKEEERYLATEKKAREAEEEVKGAETTAETKKKEIAAAAALLEEKKEALKAFNKMPLEEFKQDEKGNAERKKALEADIKSAGKVVKDVQNELASVLKKKETAAEVAAKRRAELEAARQLKRKGKAGAGKKAAVSDTDVKKAAAKAGDNIGAVALSLADIRQGIKDVSNYKEDARVAAIGTVFLQFLLGGPTPKLMCEELLAILNGGNGTQSTPTPAPAPAPVAPKKGKK